MSSSDPPSRASPSTTLFRYGTNLLTHVVHDPEADLERLLQRS